MPFDTFKPFSFDTFKPFSFDSSLHPAENPDDADVSNPKVIPCQYYTNENIDKHDPNINNCNLSLFHLNTQSLNKKANDLVNYLSSIHNHFDIYGFSETWFTSDIDANIIDLGDYSSENCNREGRRGGGVSLFIKSDLNYVNRPDLVIDCIDCDSLFVEISHNSTKIIIGIVYKPEYVVFNDFFTQLGAVLNTISSEKKSCYIMGDFNLDLLTHETNSKVNDFINMFYSYDFIPSIDRPTRVRRNNTGHISATLIDNIFTNDILAHITSGVLITDLSDHFPIFVTQQNSNSANNTPSTPLSRKSRLFKPNNIKGLKNALSLTDWQLITNTTDPEEAYNKFNNKFTELLDIHCPIKTKQNSKRNTPKKPWVTKGLIKSLKTKDKLYKTYISKPTFDNKLNYTKYRNNLNLLLRLSKKSYITNKITTNKDNTKEMWKTLNNLLGRNKKSQLPDFFTSANGENICDNKIIAEGFNNFFANIGIILANKISEPSNVKPSKTQTCNSSSLFIYPTSPDEILKITSKLKYSNSSGTDDISNNLLKQIIPSICDVLSHIFNLSFTTGVVPSLLKQANVTPIFKAGDKHDFTNYRPISILPSISKLLEKVIYARILDFINHHDILTPHQFGFRPKRSTYMAINDLYCKIANNLDNKLYTAGIFLDLSKAFDTINHNILLDKLSNYGIRGLANDWLRSYLSGRQQRVLFNNTLSNPAKVTCGVPQGSILGPLLFLLYINDLPLCTKTPHFVLFADDTNILFSHHDPKKLEDTINNELLHISNWFKLNKLSLNIKKTNYIIFKNKHSNKPNINLNIKIDGTVLQQVDTTKFLGLLIDSNLSWSSHTQHTSKIISKLNGVIRKVRPFLPLESLHTLYNSLILPYFSYGAMIWTDPNNTSLDSLFLLQKRVIRSCTNSPWLAHTDPLFSSLKTLKIHDIYKLQLAVFMYQYHNNLLPNDLIDDTFFNTAYPAHNYETRHANTIFIKPTKTILASNTSASQGPLLWNNIPTNIQTSSSLASFKANLKKFFIGCYNPLDSD